MKQTPISRVRNLTERPLPHAFRGFVHDACRRRQVAPKLLAIVPFLRLTKLAPKSRMPKSGPWDEILNALCNQTLGLVPLHAWTLKEKQEPKICRTRDRQEIQKKSISRENRCHTEAIALNRHVNSTAKTPGRVKHHRRKNEHRLVRKPRAPTLPGHSIPSSH